MVKVMHKFFIKMCWATFWAITSQTRLVTLLPMHEKLKGKLEPKSL
jgi:hypothetical protein